MTYELQCREVQHAVTYTHAMDLAYQVQYKVTSSIAG